MKVQISFKIINPEYDQDYADQYEGGKESGNNMKYRWATTYELKNAKSVELIEDGVYELKGQFKNGQEFNFPISNVALFRCHLENDTIEDFAVSKSILNKTHQARNEKYKTTRCYFYLNQEPAHIELGSNLIIDEKDVPKEMYNNPEESI
jgi:hypothetical protein